MPNFWIYGFHAVFFFTFLPRLLLRRRRPAAPNAPPDQQPALHAQPDQQPALESAPEPEATAVTDRYSRVVLGFHAFAMFVLYFGIGAVVSGRPLRIFPVRFLFPPQPAAGAAVILAAAGLAAWTLTVFGSWRLRARVEQGHELATGGPFRFVRNPIYLGMILIAAGSFLWMPTPVVLTGLLLICVGADLRARAEERVLGAAFGDAYRQYATRVKRFVPGIY